MAEKKMTVFNFGLVDFADKESIAEFYSSGGGIWHHEEAIFVKSYYTTDVKECRRRGVSDEPEIGLHWELHFTSPELQAQIARTAPENRGGWTGKSFSLGKYAAGDGVRVVKPDGTYVDPNATDPEDLKGVALAVPHGYKLWDRSNYFLLHQHLSEVVPPEELKETWNAVYTSKDASKFVGLRAIVDQIEVPMDAAAKEKARANFAKRRKDESKAVEWRPPMITIIDEPLGWEDIDAIRAYDPNATVITEAAVEAIKELIAKGSADIAEIGKKVLNENPGIHGEVHAALQDLGALESKGIYWRNQQLTLEA